MLSIGTLWCVYTSGHDLDAKPSVLPQASSVLTAGRRKSFLPGSSSDPFQYTSSGHRKWPPENLLDGNGICWAQPRKLEVYNPRAAGGWVYIPRAGSKPSPSS
jgi:hypothetical protein